MSTTNPRRPAFDPSNPWLVFREILTDGEDLSDTFSEHCCERAAEEQRRYLRAKGALNVRVELRRPVPRKGMGGNWRIVPGPAPKHTCSLSPRFVEGEEGFPVAL